MGPDAAGVCVVVCGPVSSYKVMESEGHAELALTLIVCSSKRGGPDPHGRTVFLNSEEMVPPLNTGREELTLMHGARGAGSAPHVKVAGPSGLDSPTQL